MSYPATLPPVPVRVLRVRPATADDLPLPAPATPEASGVDLLADLTGPLEVAPGARVLVPTGLALALPPGWEGQIRPRSGLALRHGLTVLNAPGTIDADYRGEVQVLLINLGQAPIWLERGMRIAQLVLGPVGRVQWIPCDELPASSRGAGGFGHTG